MKDQILPTRISSKVLGRITGGANALIGANAVVTKNVPQDMVAVGIPAKIMQKRYEDASA